VSVLVLGVVPGSPAEVAGLKPPARNRLTGDLILGDVIVEFDGKPVKEPDDLFRLLDHRRVGDEVPMVLERKGKRRRVTITLAAD
jgi:S1-C subfamily serine protease